MISLKESNETYKSYLHRIQSLPMDLRRIHEKYWDDTGRPAFGTDFRMIVVDLLDSIKTFKAFEESLRQMNLEVDDAEIVYSIYIAGMKRLNTEIEDRRGS